MCKVEDFVWINEKGQVTHKGVYRFIHVNHNLQKC